MNYKYFLRSVQIAALILLIIVLQKCGSEDSINAPQDFMAGTITFSDVSFLPTSAGHYTISFYTDKFLTAPVRSDSLVISISGTTATSYWKSEGLASTSYYIGATWIQRSNGAISILGELGCATPPSCADPTKVDFPNYAGTAGLDFPSKTHN